jgi:thiol-disulfide isomerase/thioredoxin
MKKIFLGLAFIAMLAASLSATPLATELENSLKAAQSEAEAVQAIMSFTDRMTELEDWRVLQNYWMNINPAACQEFFAQKKDQFPDSPEFEYLWLRNQKDPALQLSKGREMISKHPGFYWGYRIFSATYAQVLQDPDTPDSLKADVRDKLQGDLALLQQGASRFPLDDYIGLALYHYWRSQGNNDQAEYYLINLFDLGAIEANIQNVFDFAEASGRTRAFEVLFPKVISRQIAKNELAPGDSLAYYQFFYLEVLRKARDWNKMQACFETYPELKTNDDTIRYRILMNIGLKQEETALNLLEGGMAAELLKYPEVVQDPDYESLHVLPRWDSVMALAAKNWEESKAIRKAEALSKKTSKPAPLWELPDKDGNNVRLEDLRGKIVILDFWALWCKPCLQTMPLLDAWLKKDNSGDVRVFSINTWENPSDHDNAATYIQKNRYGMTLLYGNNELPKAYGFTGIPWICVIDQEGNIAFEHSGYSPELPELLDFWVGDLRR